MRSYGAVPKKVIGMRMGMGMVMVMGMGMPGHGQAEDAKAGKP
jgi:hypothetical protein